MLCALTTDEDLVEFVELLLLADLDLSPARVRLRDFDSFDVCGGGMREVDEVALEIALVSSPSLSAVRSMIG